MNSGQSVSSTYQGSHLCSMFYKDFYQNYLKWKSFNSERVNSCSHPCQIIMCLFYMHIFIYVNILLLSSLNYLFNIFFKSSLDALAHQHASFKGESIWIYKDPLALQFYLTQMHICVHLWPLYPLYIPKLQWRSLWFVPPLHMSAKMLFF